MGFEKKEHLAISALLPSNQNQFNFTMKLIMFATVHGFGSSPLSYKEGPKLLNGPEMLDKKRNKHKYPFHSLPNIQNIEHERDFGWVKTLK